MNAKKAKALRKVLRNLKKEKGDEVIDVSYTENIRNRKTVTVADFDEHQQVVPKQITLADGTMKLDVSSIKGMYRSLKQRMNEL